MTQQAQRVEPHPGPGDAGDTAEKAGEYLRMALLLMAKHQIPTTPYNYAVFYEYVAGRSRELVARVDEVLASQTALNAELSRDLFSRYVHNCDTQLIESLRAELRSIVAETMGYVNKAGSEASRSSHALQQRARQIAEAPDMAEIPRLLSEVVTETRSITQASHGLEQNLNSTAREVEALRKELERVKVEVTTDTLTGALNRRAFENALSAFSQRTRFCLLLLDIDHFKRVNDTYGHLVGDKVLRLIGSMLTACVKGKDVVARYGGEEFAVLLPDTPSDGAYTVAESIRRTVERSRLKRTDTGDPLGVITLSVGVAQYRMGEPADELIQRCDEALYRAKHQGRNRTVAAR